MKKAVLKISILFLIPILLTIPYTSAYFSSQAISKENTFKAGNLSIKDPGQIISDNDFNNLYPGWKDNKTIKLYNDGTLNFKCKMSIYCNSDSILYNGDNCLKVTITDTDEHKVYCENKKISDIKDMIIGKIGLGASRTLKFEFSLPDEADNNYSGKSCDLSFVFDAVQEDAPFVFNVDQGDSIQNAVNNALDGDIINIHKGTYYECLNINKNLILEGCGDKPKDVVICKSNSYSQNSVISINADQNKEIRISNLEIDGKNDDHIKYGITADSKLYNLFVEDVVFTNNKSAAIYIKSDISNIHLINCKIDNKSGNGFTQCSGTIANLGINGCSFNNCSYAISYRSIVKPAIDNCTYTNCKENIFIQKL